MKRVDAIAALKQRETELRRAGATALWLFGSTARDEAGPKSDLDIFIEYDRAGQFSLLDLVHVKHVIEDHINQPVDMTTRDSLDPLLRQEILDDAVQVF
jgi:uncharacterized protein